MTALVLLSMAACKKDETRHARGLTADQPAYRMPSFAPESRRLIVTRTSGSGSNLVEIAENGATRIVHNPPSVGDLGWPSYITDDLIVASSGIDGKLVKMRRGGQDVQALTAATSVNDGCSRYNQKDKRIYFARAQTKTRRGWTDYDVYSMDLNGADLVRISGCHFSWIGSIAFDAADEGLLVSAVRRDKHHSGNTTTWFVPTHGGTSAHQVVVGDRKHRRIFDERDCRFPCGSEQCLYFVGPSEFDGPSKAAAGTSTFLGDDIYRFETAANSKLRRLTSLKGSILGMTMSTDGKCLAYITQKQPLMVQLLDVSGGEPIGIEVP